MKKNYTIKWFYLFGAAMLYFNSLVAQTTFNHRYHLNFPATIFSNIIPTDSCYYATGIALDSVLPYYTGNIFVQFDLEGIPINVKSLMASDRIISTREPAFMQTLDHNFIAAGTQIDSIRKVILIKYNTDGDTLFTREFLSLNYPADPFIYLEAMEITQDSGFILVNNVEDPLIPGNTDISVIKADKDGNMLWQKVYGNTIDNIAEAIVPDSDGGFIIGGVTDNTNLTNTNYLFQTWLLKIDSIGEVVWEYKTPPLFELNDAARDMVLLEDGSMVIATGIGTQYDFPASSIVRFNNSIAKINTGLAEEWNREFFQPEQTGSERLNTIVAVSDGSGYVAAGKAGEIWMNGPAFTVRGWLAKISPEGDSLWTRKYEIVPSNNPRHEILDLKETLDGGFIMVGEARDAMAGTQTQQGWLLKTDSHGCLVPGCHTPVTETPTENIQLSIYPNPTSDYLNFLIRQQKRPKNGSVRIVNAAGQLVQQIEAVEKEVTYMLPVWHWEAGIYFLQYLENGMVRGVEKVVVH